MFEGGAMNRYVRTLVALATSVVFLAMAVPALAAPQATVSGTVYGSDNVPVPGASVTVSLADRNGVYRVVANRTTDASGWWTYAGKSGAYEFDVVAPSFDPITRYLTMVNKRVYTLDVTLTPLVGTISGRVVSGPSATPVRSAFVWFYKQNADGTWPATSPGWGTPTFTVYSDSLGNYTSGDLPLGNYMVRFFTSMTGSQWWQYVATVDLATVVTIDTPGQTISGIDGWFYKPL